MSSSTTSSSCPIRFTLILRRLSASEPLYDPGGSIDILCRGKSGANVQHAAGAARGSADRLPRKDRILESSRNDTPSRNRMFQWSHIHHGVNLQHLRVLRLRNIVTADIDRSIDRPTAPQRMGLKSHAFIISLSMLVTSGTVLWTLHSCQLPFVQNQERCRILRVCPTVNLPTLVPRSLSGGKALKIPDVGDGVQLAHLREPGTDGCHDLLASRQTSLPVLLPFQ